jgi:hypothetical protein
MLGAIRTAYRLAAGAITLSAVAVQYWLIAGDKEGTAFLSSTLHFFSFFTILTNLLAGAALLWPVLGPRSDIGRFLDRPSVRTAIAGYIIVVGTVYYLLLSDVSDAQGWQLVLEHVLHYVTPPLFVLDWLLFVPKGNVAWGNGLACLGFPAAYAAWTLGHGAATGWYPYHFLDVPDLGYAQTLLNIAGLVLAFLVLDLALVGIGRAMARAAERRRSNSSLS